MLDLLWLSAEILLHRATTGGALVEAETAGIVVEPKASEAERNSRLGRLVEMVLGEAQPARAAHLARQADEGLLTIQELDHAASEADATGRPSVVSPP